MIDCQGETGSSSDKIRHNGRRCQIYVYQEANNNQILADHVKERLFCFRRIFKDSKKRLGTGVDGI